MAIVVLGLGVTDRYLRDATMDRLLDAVEPANQARTRMVSTLEQTKQLVTRSDSLTADPNKIRESVAALVKAARELESTCQFVGETPVLPWHRAIRSARDSWVAHCEAWIAHLQAVGRDFRSAYQSNPDMGATYQSARNAFRKAIQRPSLHDLAGRVDSIFTG